MRIQKIMICVGISLLYTGLVWASDLQIVEQDKKPVEQNEPTILKAKDEIGTPVIVTDQGVAKPSDKKGIPWSQALQGSQQLQVVSPAVGEPTRYTLGPDDVIEINVRRHPEFSGNYPINSEGKIQYKFVGDIEIKGLSKTDVKDKINQILSKFIINPDVDVTIMEYRSKIIYVIGEVGAPGKYYMKADKISLREAVVQAGLPTLSAAMRRTQLIRPDKTGKPKEKTVDLYALLYEGKLNLDQDMYPGDVLVVPATLFAKVMRIINPVAEPIMTSDNVRRVGTGGF